MLPGIGSGPDFIVEEADVAEIHAAMKANRLTALHLQYKLQRSYEEVYERTRQEVRRAADRRQ